MRPIDANALREVVISFQYTPTSDENERCVRAIDSAPTVEMPGWISVKDRLPEKLQTVMVSLVSEIDGHRMKRPQLGYPADGTGNMWYIVPWGEWAVDIDFEVTHWMPLPEPPEGVQE